MDCTIYEQVEERLDSNYSPNVGTSFNVAFSRRYRGQHMLAAIMIKSKP